ncbi:interleukin-2 receptor subunit beta isoform X1 [Rhineura floridana]|uniref:interleukin-2 receptor subunit beta isoform X1 n=1 Tax=Rhineura floridana TaxID=261503 RepID=UPI002AC81D6A|nr:interleukin-2 receptor subunit beta isoform X1 [Rhineura floridana]XP_061495032.1 interleukin-2 receptor subunit beta isoform X1 [Rhineura floridana]XP_061495033.1 interleukin-2 receptor subunit beta isoform X1 [Rhineura floridana]
MKTSPAVLLCVLSFTMASMDVSSQPQSHHPSEPSPESSSLVCFYDSVVTIICTWTPVKNATEAQCQLTASVTFKTSWEPKSCQLHGTSNKSCELILKGYSLTVTDDILVVVSCHTGENWVHIQNQTFDLFQNIQLKPPCNVRLENASKPSYNLTWELCVVSYYLTSAGMLEYEIRYKRNDFGEANTILFMAQDQKWLKFESLSPDTVYEAAVRVIPRGYKSIWSNWSTPVTWKTEPKTLLEAPAPSAFLPVLLTLVGCAIFISIFLITIFLLGKTPTSKCLRKVLKSHLPDPVEFFPSLAALHGGDVQKWLSSPASSFHMVTAVPDVSVLEIMQKGNQESCLLLPKECLTNMDTPETSGHSSSSCFTNRGYFFFHHLDSLEIEPCKVYFTYDPVAQEFSGGEDGNSDSYKVLHEMRDNQPPPAYSIMTGQENDSLLQEAKGPNQKVGACPRALPSGGSSPVVSEVEQDEDREGDEATVQSSKSPEQHSMEFSCVLEQSGSNTDGTEAIRNIDPPNGSKEENRPAFLQAMVQNPGQANDLCRAGSSSQVPSSSEAYLSLKDLQGHYSHHSV